MRRLHTHSDGTMTLVETLDDGERVYSLKPEGQVFLTQLLRLGENDEVRARDLQLMLDRGWAILQPPTPKPSEPVAQPKPAPALVPAADAPTTPEEPRPLLSRRTRGREVALQVLYLMEQNAGVDQAQVEQFVKRRLREPKLIAFTKSIVEGVREHMKHLDNLISDVAENWRIDRMAAIDRNILRVGAYEMLYCADVPTKVAINEALELAKRYSTAQSSRFVNGILDRLQTAKPESAAEGPPAESEPSDTNPS